MLKHLMIRVKLFSFLLLISTSFYGIELVQLNRLYIRNFVRGKVTPLPRLRKLYGRIESEQLAQRLVWGKLVIQTLQEKSLKKNSLYINSFVRDLENLYKDIRKMPRGTKPYVIFLAAEFAFELLGLHDRYKMSMSKSELSLYSKDALRKVIFNDPKSQLANRSRVMLAISKVSSTDSTTSSWNAYILENLSDDILYQISNKRIQYLAYLYRATMYRKIGYSKESQISLNLAKEMFPRAKIDDVLEERWASGKEGF